MISKDQRDKYQEELDKMRIVPLNLKDANLFVSHFHRHNRKVQGAKFSIGLMKGDELIGVAIAGRPIARLSDDGKTLEVLRVCTKEGHKNATSKLYARIKRIAQLMGYIKIITYTLNTESGSSLKAIKAVPVAVVYPSSWDRTDRRRENQPITFQSKIKWEL
jgi:hypothetical protein